MNITISPEVDEAIRIRAAKEGVDEGTVIDALVWRALLDPRRDGTSPQILTSDQLERLLCEEVLEELAAGWTFDEFLDALPTPGLEEKTSQVVRSEVRSWRKKRRVPKEWQEGVISALGTKGFVPTALREGIVGLEWFSEEA